MTELSAIERSEEPASADSIATDLRRLGLDAGATLMVHSSLSRLGYVVGGAHAVVLALLDVVGSEGTLMMPTHSGDLSDPAAWRNPPVPESWWETIRSAMPAFDPLLTPTRAMGAVVECFRHLEGVQRSDHPTVSAAAHGHNASFLVSGHELAFGLGESSPQARLYDLDGLVLLLGVSHANNTSLHLAEYRANFPNKRWVHHGSPVLIGGERRWVTYEDLEEGSDDFRELGEAFSSTGLERRGKVAGGVGRLFRARDVVDFAVSWMETNRAAPAG